MKRSCYAKIWRGWYHKFGERKTEKGEITFASVLRVPFSKFMVGFGCLETFRLFRLTSFLLREPMALLRETFCFLLFNCQPKALNRKSQGFYLNRIEDSLNNSIGILNYQNLGVVGWLPY